MADKYTPSMIPRGLARLARVGVRHPWLILAFTLVSCGLSLAYAVHNLNYETHRNDLHSKNKEYYQRWRQYVAEFGDDNDLVVVIEGPNRVALIAALEDLAGRLEQRPDLFDRLFYKVDLRSLGNRALLFLPTEDLRRIQEHIHHLGLLLEPPVLAGLDPLFGWKSLTLLQLLQEGRRHLGDPHDPFLGQLGAICAGAAQFLHDPKSYHNPWQSIVPADSSDPNPLTTPQYFLNDSATLAFLLVRPAKDGGDGNFTFNQTSIVTLRGLLKEWNASHPEVVGGLTGLPVLEHDEMVATQTDSTLASWLALAGVALLYLIVYRGWRYPFLTVATLLIGTFWALGWLTLTVGHLNILSSAFAVMLIGMGDYGVLWVTRFGQERLGGNTLAEAMEATAVSVGPSILTAALTTSLAFFAAMLADLKAVAELGWIAGSGVLLCALACFVVLPALLTLFHSSSRAVAEAPILSLAQARAERTPWLGSLMRRPVAVLAAAGILVLVLTWQAARTRCDHNLLHLQAPELDSVQWEHKLVSQNAESSWHALSYTNTPEEALALKARFEQLPGVGRVVEVASLVPRDQERKLEIVADVARRLRRLPEKNVVIPHALPAAAELKQAIRTLLADLGPAPTGPALTSLRADLQSLQRRLQETDASEIATELRDYQQRMVRDLADDLHRLRDAATPSPITPADLPGCLRERYLGYHGKWLLRIFAQDSLWEYDALEAFIAQVQSVDPEATGKPFTTFEGLRAMKEGFLWAGVYAFLAMVLVLLMDFGRMQHMLLALLPLGLGLAATLGLMVLLGQPLNPANMIAFPLILGVGADNGVHVLHDYLGRKRNGPYRLGQSTGRGILVAALTTILGFGTLMIARHRGMASLGLALTLGVTCCMIAALVVLPALLSRISWSETKPNVGYSSEKMKAA